MLQQDRGGSGRATEHESSEKDKYRSLLRELLDAQRNRKSEQLSKEQLALFEALWKASDPEEARKTPSRTAEPGAGQAGEPHRRRSEAGGSLWPASEAGTHRARSGRSGEALRRAAARICG